MTKVARGVRPLVERFWAKVDRSGGPDACWPCTGATRTPSSGQLPYGRLWAHERYDYAHRIAYELANGPIPPDKPFVLHSCDNPPCCNPKHLWAGTNLDNMRDMIAKGRAVSPARPRGEQNASAKLTADEVREIRALVGISHAALARRYSVGSTAIRAIRQRLTWIHVK